MRWFLRDQRAAHSNGTTAPSFDDQTLIRLRNDSGRQLFSTCPAYRSQRPLTHRKGNLLGEPAAEVDQFKQLDLDAWTVRSVTHKQEWLHAVLDLA